MARLFGNSLVGLSMSFTFITIYGNYSNDANMINKSRPKTRDMIKGIMSFDSNLAFIKMLNMLKHLEKIASTAHENSRHLPLLNQYY